MSINTLSIRQAEQALDEGKELMQLFTCDYKHTFFLTKDEYKVKYISSFASLHDLVCSVFDYTAYRIFLDQTARPSFADLNEFIQRMRPGVVVGTEEDLNEYVNGPVPHYYVSGNKFTVQHFPKGTLVTTSSITHGLHRDPLPSVLYVTKVVQNDIDSFCLVTSTPSPYSFDSKEGFYTFNMTLVDTIVMRGTGGLVVERFLGYDPERLKRMDATEMFTETSRKNYYMSGMTGCTALVEMLVSQLSRREGAVVDYRSLTDSILKQSFVKRVLVNRRVHRPDHYVFSINKKRAKRFVKQNVNRFLMSAREAQYLDDEEGREATYRSLEFDEGYDFTHQ